MKIVILDGYTLNPGDLSWEALEALGQVTIHDRTAPEQIVERAAGAEAVIVNKVVLSESTLAQLPQLRYVGVMATGYNNIDVAAARKQNIVVTNAKAYSSASTAQHTFALLLALTNHAELHSQSARAGEWSQTPDFCYWKTPLVELAGKTMGLIGLGDIGAQVAQLAKAFGMKVLVHRKNPAKTGDEDIELASVEEVFRRSDVVSLHCPLTDETKEIVNARSLGWMKPSAFLLNTGRGGLVREQDLADALAAGTLAGAGLDVLSTEPPQADNPLLSAPNCLVTPHIAWASYESRKRLLQIVVDNVKAFQEGTPQNVVS
ncbi:D-2-hydroxyacid dehydrogenase [Rhabdobacter roseus]|uniref:Glycerate dehydrogenase n=1 Tax=Rhabdobacter roseus TaxID=1655419 RepID=A0A840TSB7_9BACT|nr:D-2-hydroxyacid dehydrogenase [Rhabdobacter roseus]MBB5286841.1 glycerate dehydrogenase [Rhabdobacter roseus]